MNPLRLSLRHFRCYEQLDFDFPDGLTSIVGEIRDGDDGVDSNGAGKSTIALAVDVALFGAEGRESLAQYQTHGTEGMLIELEFEHRDRKYRVRRGLSPKGKPTVDFEEQHFDSWGPGEPDPYWTPLSGASIKETDQKIENVLGITRATFRASSLLLQDAAAFPELEPRERIGLLSQMLGLERWEQRRSLVLVEKQSVAYEVERLTAVIGSVDEQLAGLDDAKTIAADCSFAESETKRELEQAEAALEKTVDAYREMNEQVEARRTAIAEHDAAMARLQPLDERSRAGEEALAEMPRLKVRIDELTRLCKRYEDTINRNAETLQARQAFAQRKAEKVALETGARQLRAKAAAVAIDDSTCDRCGQTLGAEAAERAHASLIVEANALAAKAAGITLKDVGEPEPMPAELVTAPEELGAANERLRILVETVERQPANLAELAAAREALEAAKKKLIRLPSPDADEMVSLQQAGLEARSRVNEAKERVHVTTRDNARAQAELERLTKLEATTRGNRAERDRLQVDLDVLAVFDKAYGRDGLPARYLETVALPHIEAAASRLLARMGAGCRVRFNTVREKKTGGAKDELYVEIVWDNGDVQEYKHFSGGEKTRIALSISLALAEFLAGRDRASDLLVVDEPQYLDGAGMDALVEILHDLGERVPKVMLVAHDPRIAEAFDQTVRVVRERGRSVVQGQLEEVAA